jgi:putative transposase
MGQTSDIRTGRHCVFLLHAHLVFVTKYRHPVFTDAHLSRLEDIFQAVCADLGCDLVEYNREAEHVHLLLTYPDGATVPAGELPQGRLVPTAAAGVP